MKHKSLEHWGRAEAKERYGSVGGTGLNEHLTANPHAPQDVEDKHGACYDNDTTGWVRGMGPKSPYPHFDKKGSRG